LPVKNCDHPLTGKWKDYRDWHIRPDWLLIYQLESEKLTLVRTGSHAELFR
jgi:mRNA interferase YafQ